MKSFCIFLLIVAGLISSISCMYYAIILNNDFNEFKEEISNIQITEETTTYPSTEVDITNNITQTKFTIDNNSIVNASDVMKLPAINELVAGVENDVVSRFVYCSSNNTYYLLSGDDIVDSFKTTPDPNNDFRLVEDFVIYTSKGNIYYWKFGEKDVHLAKDITDDISWPLTDEQEHNFLYNYGLIN